MISVEKSISDNPFVDNLMYYAKFLALNCNVKDEEEALKYETVESLRDGDIYIACYEGKANYEMFTRIPAEILEKYITKESNLDMMVRNPATVITHLNSYGLYERERIQRNLNTIAQSIYMDHYNIMMNYIENQDPDWAANNRELYEACVNETATYKDLFYELPLYTRKRIILQYINNLYVDDTDAIVNDLSAFQNVIDKRSDAMVETELKNINMAMRNVFKSHYEMMINRGYVREDGNNNWYEYLQIEEIYIACRNKTATYVDLFDLFPEDDLIESLSQVINPLDIEQYHLTDNVDILIEYFSKISTNPTEEIQNLNTVMINKYIVNYNQYLNYDVYNQCENNLIDYFGLIKYMPKETLKMILNTQFEEVTNLEIYANNKDMLDSYLNSLDKDKSLQIKKNIVKDMIPWYLANHEEKNNYYRTLIGLPPLKEDGTPYIDTLVHSESIDSSMYIDLKDLFYDINKKTNGMYPEVHWKSQLCEFDSYDVSILTQYGIIDKYVELCSSNLYTSRYSYLRFLGDNKLDLYTCRKAMNFQLIGLPTVDNSSVKNKFASTFAVNRDYVLRTVYSDAYAFQSDYYNKFMIIFILINTIMDMLADIPRMLIDRDVFDSRCIKYLFESFGIPYYSEIPVKYQRAMLKNLNILIKYKSSTKNMIDICNLFGFSDIKVFNYYMFKERVKDSNTGEYVFNDDTEIDYDLSALYVRDDNGDYKDYNGIKYSKLLEYRNYDEDKYLKTINIVTTDKDGNEVIKTKKIINNKEEVYLLDESVGDYFIPLSESDYFKKIKANVNTANLKFIKVPTDDKNLTNYKNDPNNIINYDEVVYEDDTWDGGLQHEDIRQQIKDYEFNAVLTKYISVETVTDMTELAFQVSYFYNMIFDNLYSEEALTVEIPYIRVGHKFRFMDIICYLFSLMYLYNGLNDNIMYSPTQVLYLKGYNFDQCLNKVLDDAKAFTQPIDEDCNVSFDKAENIYRHSFDHENIFDINDRIAEDNYNYRDSFPHRIRGFNLEVDMDELDKWLSQYQLSLDDFIVYDEDEAKANGFTQEITLRNFYSLFNSFYQKSIFKDALLPTQYNNDIKYAFDEELYKKQYIKDMNGIVHSYIIRNGELLEVFDSKDTDIFIINNNQYVSINSDNYTIYYKYTKDKDNYILNNVDYYKYDKNTNTGEYEYTKILQDTEGSIYIKNKDGDYVFSAENYYTKNNETGEYSVITNENNFYVDYNNKSIIKYGIYYILKDGEYILDPDNCYVYDSTYDEYILARDRKENVPVSEEECYILHSDGHFIPLVETDYYRKQEDGSYKYDEEICYIKSPNNEVTNYYDPVDNPRIYYKKLTDYYKDTNHVYSSDFYVLDPDGNFIPEKDLVSPNNCYYKIGDIYYMVKDNLVIFKDYKNPMNVKYCLIMQDNNNYNRYILQNRDEESKYNDRLSSKDFINYPEDNVMYIKDSDSDYVLVLFTDAKYEKTKSMIVVFNHEVKYGDNFIDKDNKYNPEKTDKVWDENDWFYKDPSYTESEVGMNGENMWYYRKPGSEIIPDKEEQPSPVGSGFYLAPETYLGDINIEKGAKYYISMDIETNFDGIIQVCCESDSECIDSISRNYNVRSGIILHISQLFIANDIQRPRMKFLIYDFKNYPIEISDYIIVSNIRVVRGYNNEYIAQDIPSYDKLQEIYRTNEAIYKYLTKKMVECSDYDMYQIYKHLYDSMMIAKYNKEAFKLENGTYAKTYTDFLQTRDSVLYEKLTYFKSLDIDAMHKEVADNIVEVTYAIDDCVDTYSYGYLYSYFPAVSANYIQQYISKIINFFKSWKVHLLGINTVYKFNDPMENTIKILEDQEYRIRNNQIDYVYINDSAVINPMDSYSPDGNKYSDKYEDMVKFSHKYEDNVLIDDKIRIIRSIADRIEYTDNYENIHLILRKDDIKAAPSIDGNLIVNTGSGLSVALPNNLILTTDEDDKTHFGTQPIGQINYDSEDLIGGNYNGK